MAKHALREVKVANAVPDAPKPSVIAGAATVAAILERVAQLKAAAIAAGQRWRKDQVESLDVLVTSSRQDMQRMTVEQQDSYFRKSLDWLARRFGGETNILSAVVHRDEATPHLQVLIAPVGEDGKFNAKRMLGGPGELSKMQDAFHADVARHYSLERGEKGSKAKHIPIRTFYAHANLVKLGQAEDLEDIPPAPLKNWKTVRSGEYKAAKEAREAVIARNQERLKKVRKERLQLRAMHPSQREKLAADYRANVAMKDLAEKARKEAKEIQKDAQERMQIAVNAEAETRKMAIAAGSIFERTEGAKMLDKASMAMDPVIVARVAKNLQIKLVPGRGLLDQIRKQGRAKDMLSAAKLLTLKLEELEQLTTLENQVERHRPAPPRER